MQSFTMSNKYKKGVDKFKTTIDMIFHLVGNLQTFFKKEGWNYFFQKN